MILFKEGFTIRKETDVTVCSSRLKYPWKEDEMDMTGWRGRGAGQKVFSLEYNN